MANAGLAREWRVQRHWPESPGWLLLSQTEAFCCPRVLSEAFSAWTVAGRLAVWCNRGWRGEHRSWRNPWDCGYFFGGLQGLMAAFVVVLERPSSVVPIVAVSMIGYVALRILSSCISVVLYHGRSRAFMAAVIRMPAR